MKVRAEFRDRSEVEVRVLDALADRKEEGMTVFELRSHVDADIDDLEEALAALKADGLIDATENGSRTVILIDERVVPEEPADEDESLLDSVFEKLGL
ncbi:MAG: DUF6432 family protein [Halanaeroarchaeum sp.]